MNWWRAANNSLVLKLHTKSAVCQGHGSQSDQAGDSAAVAEVKAPVVAPAVVAAPVKEAKLIRLPLRPPTLLSSNLLIGRRIRLPATTPNRRPSILPPAPPPPPASLPIGRKAIFCPPPARPCSRPTAAQPAVNMAAEQKVQAQQAPAVSGPKYTGEPISVNLKDVDLKDFFRLIHEISGLNVVLDPNVRAH